MDEVETKRLHYAILEYLREIHDSDERIYDKENLGVAMDCLRSAIFFV